MPNTLRKFQYILEGIDQEQLTDILVKRLKSRYPDISTKYEEDVLHDAAMDVASFHAGAEELGTSDIGSMIREVIKNLERFNQRGQGEKMIPNSVRGWRINEETEPERVVRQLKTAKKYLGQDPEPKEPEEKETNESYWGGPSPAQLRFNRALKKQQNSPENKADREKFQKEIDRIMPPPKKPEDKEEQISEKINKDVFSPGWRDETTILDGKYKLVAKFVTRPESQSYKRIPYLLIEVFDPEGEAPTHPIAFVRFEINGLLWWKNLQAGMVQVSYNYRRQGIATAMYQYVQHLGNTIKPSPAQLPDGKAMWKGFAKKTLEPAITEKTSPKIFNRPKNAPIFSTKPKKIGNYIFDASEFEGSMVYGKDAKGLIVRAYDPKNMDVIGSASFVLVSKKGKNGDSWLESDDTKVKEKYRGKGIATSMYQYAKDLGNDIKPSPYKSNAGGAMWKAWGRDVFEEESKTPSGKTDAGYTWQFELGREVPMKPDVDANTFIRVKDPTGKTVAGIWADVAGDSIQIEYSQVFDEELRGRGVYTDLLRSLSKQYNVISDKDNNNAATSIYKRLGADYDHRQATHTLRKQGVAEGAEQDYLSQIPNLTWKPVSRSVWNTIQDEGLDEEQDAPKHTDWVMASLSIDPKDARALQAFDNDAIEDFNRFDIHLKSRYPGLTDLIDYDRGTVTIVKPIQMQGVAEGLLDRFINKNNTKDKKINLGDYTLEIQTKNDKLFVYVTTAGEDVFDVAEAEFNIRLDDNGKKYLESEFTKVYPKYQRKGIATMIYQYLKLSGYDVQPSSTQTDQGKSMWKGFREKGVAEDEHDAQPRPRAVDSMKSMVDVDGIKLNVAIDGAEVSIRPIVDGHQAGYVVFDRDGRTLVPNDLAIDDEFRGRGIAKIIYDYVKSLGFTIRRSSDQTRAGKHFWDKNRGEDSQVWEQTMTAKELDEACWKGYHKEGNKKMFGKTYPNCVKNTNEEQDMEEDKKPSFMKSGNMKPFTVTGKEKPGAVNTLEKLLMKAKERGITLNYHNIDQMMQAVCKKHNLTGDDLHNHFVDKHHMIPDKWIKKQDVSEAMFTTESACPHCGGELVSEEMINEKKDACYYKVKSRYKVWPSAYASGALVKCRKKGASNWGNSSKNESSILEGLEQTDENLHKWFKEKWVRFGPDGKIRGACARGDDSEGKPKCLPQSKAQNLGKKGRASAAARKRREDPNPERSGKAINVATKKKTSESSILQGISETKGLPMPGSYEQENKPFLRKGGQKLMALTTEQEELDEKWSDKYKKSIDCSHPKGFSQRAHCQGRKKK